jgi:site-specific DNA-methyltransferase (adenine-specific)
LEHLLQGKFARNIISVPSLRGSSHEKVGHPCQKPIALILILLLLTTDPGDLVLDPFLGSGTTAVSNESRRLL